MRLIYLTFLWIAAVGMTHAQLNTTLQSNLKYPTRLNDIWGWVAPDGTEYALVGVFNGVSIVSLADPTNPRQVAFVPGGNSTWRDLKTWGNYVYVTTDQPGTREGLVIIDLAQLPDTVTFTKWNPVIDNRTLNTCHNLYIEDGVAYLAGCNVNGGGILFIDVKTDAINPSLIGQGPPIYAHDVYVRNDTMYSSELFNGEIGIYNIANKSNPIALAKQKTPFLFTHNTWISDNSKVVYSTDEVANAPVTAYNIDNLDNIIKLDEFRPAKSLNTGTIPHNVHVKDDYLMISYYTDGGIIVDAARPDNLIEVANYDTFLGNNGGFNGAWGLYPFLRSGNILISDINTGLWVVKPDLKRACYLEGTVSDSLSGQRLAGVNVTILSELPNQEQTNLNGIYKTGQVSSGTFTVRFEKTDYYPKNVSVNLQNGVLTTLNVQLQPIPKYNVSGTVVSQQGNAGVNNAKVLIVNEQFAYEETSNLRGNFNLSGIEPGTYDIFVGAWGYNYNVIENVAIDNNKTITLNLTPGYEDNFLLDLGWESVSGNVLTGIWERAIPVGTVTQGITANPDADLANDLGDFCYVTGNGGGSPSNDDVDGGPVTLVSPPMNLATYTDPILSYHLWFFNAGGGGVSVPNDSLVVRVTNGVDTVTVEKITDSQSGWRPKSSIRLRNFISLSNSMKVLFETSDIGMESHIVEAAVDGFAVTESNLTDVKSPALSGFQLRAFPNPFREELTLQFTDFTGTVQLISVTGQVLKTSIVGRGETTLRWQTSVAPGVYWLRAVSEDGERQEVIKVVKL